MLFHHVGCAVESIETALISLRLFFARSSQPLTISSQGVRVCFLEMQPGCYVELVEGIANQSAVAGMLGRRVSFYHLGFLTDSFDQEVQALSAQDYRHLETFTSEAFGGRRCAFLMSPTKQLIEIVESGHDVMQK